MLNQLCVSVVLYVSTVILPILFLFDSRSAGNFISQSLVFSLSISIVKLASPISVNALDGHPLSNHPVTHDTSP